jgi:ribosome-associated toxin RatA of RatAB toxin-antitoxin module
VYTATHDFEEAEASPTHLLDAVWDVAAYPEFVKGVRAVEVLEDDGATALAQFRAGLLGVEFTYVLRCVRDERSVQWRRESGDFRDAAGQLVHLGGTRYRYENAMDPGFAVPQLAVRVVLSRGMPNLVAEFCRRARELGS